MSFSIPDLSQTRKMAIIASYQKGETYGLLGPQMAATIIETNTPCNCIVIGITNDVDLGDLKKALSAYFGSQKKLIGFAALSGRQDLFNLARELKANDAITVLAGPQAGVDFSGEVGWVEHHHRFKGVADCFSFAIQGPAEQIVPLFDSPGPNFNPAGVPGLVYQSEQGLILLNPTVPWNEKYLSKINWGNLYTLNGKDLAPVSVSMGQVLQHIGCPHAAREVMVEIDYPSLLAADGSKTVQLGMRGCSFCDVATDKGFHGRLGLDAVLSQIDCLPAGRDGRKIPFELINESPLPGLADLIGEARNRGVRISQINLTMRADWLAAGGRYLRQALEAAQGMDARILLSSIGFESFDDTILKNLNKGLTKEKNLEAIRLIRDIKEDFPRHLGYSTGEGAIHGFIHPTPWDSTATETSIKKTIAIYGLQNDILPPHSTPLIIHHASALADWIREIEHRENIIYRRHGSIITWWPTPPRPRCCSRTAACAARCAAISSRRWATCWNAGSAATCRPSRAW